MKCKKYNIYITSVLLFLFTVCLSFGILTCSSFTKKENDDNSKKLYIYKPKEDAYYITEEENNAIYAYSCSSNDCKSYYTKTKIPSILIFDKEYYLLSLDTLKKTKITLEHPIPYTVHEVYLCETKNNKKYFYWNYQDPKIEENFILYSHAIYDFQKEKEISYTNNEPININTDFIEDGVIYYSKINQLESKIEHIIYDLENEKKVNSIIETYDASDVEMVGSKLNVLKTNEQKYYLTENFGTTYTKYQHIYNEDCRPLFEGNFYSSVGILENGNLAVANTKDKTYKVYDKEGKFITESNEFEEVIALSKDFVLVVQDGYLIALDYENNIIKQLEEWEQEKALDNLESNYVSILKEKEQEIYFRITNKNKRGPTTLYTYKKKTKEWNIEVTTVGMK